LSLSGLSRGICDIRHRGDAAKSWLTFLQNHREVIAAFDFFTVPRQEAAFLGVPEPGSQNRNGARAPQRRRH